MNYKMPVMGASFRPAEAKDAIRNLAIGDDLIIEAEPGNQYDSSAVRVLTEDGVHIGYLPKDENLPIFESLTDGLEPSAVYIHSFLSPLKPYVVIEFLDR